MLDGQDVMSQLVSEDLQKGIIQTRYATTESKPIKEFIAKMDKFIKENSSENCRISLTGMTSVYMKINDSLINSQFSSLVIAILLVIVIVGLIVRSFIKGVWAAIPIIATIIINVTDILLRQDNHNLKSFLNSTQDKVLTMSSFVAQPRRATATPNRILSI